MSRLPTGIFLVLASLLISDSTLAQQVERTSAQKIVVQPSSGDAVILYSEPGFRGRNESFREPDHRLDDNRIGNDGAASIRVPKGCRVTLFEHYDFKGLSVELDEDVRDLARTRLGRSEVSSLKASCRRVDDGPDDGPDGNLDPERRLRGRRGVLVFSETLFRGRFEFFDGNERDLADRPIGGDSISSIRVARGCVLTLFSDRDFGGERTEFRRHAGNLRRTSPGPDTASSLTVNCEERGRGVTLFSDSGFRGQRETLVRDVSRLADIRLGENRVGSVRLSPGCRATLYAQRDYRGASLVVEEDLTNLAGLAVGPDAASSVRVACEDRPTGPVDLPYGSGVWLYDHSHFVGEGVRFRRDVPRLSETEIGNDRAGSIRVAPGCEAVLYRNAEYRRKGVPVTGDVEDLDRIRGIGNNKLSSIRVRCDRPNH